MSAPGRFRATPAQRAAADPHGSVWVTANAGTGKTRVLVERILRLLLAGAHPEGILAITFTKAAAAEMLQRIDQRLAAWATAPAAELAADLEDLTGTAPPADLLDRARSLFATLLELPKGLQIMTIHALCGSLLRRFPLEAEVAPHFETIDERTTAELEREAQAALLDAVVAGGDDALKEAFARLVGGLADASLMDTLAELIRCRVRIGRAAARHGGPDGLLREIRQTLDVPEGQTIEAILERACRMGEGDEEALRDVARALETVKGKSDQACAAILRTWLEADPARRRALFAEYNRAFLVAAPRDQEDDELDPRARKNVCTASFAKSNPGAVLVLGREQGRLLRIDDELRACRTYERTEALLHVGKVVIDAYEVRKRQKAALDFDDLIERTRTLLQDPERARWVLFKLDQRIDHLLVDEAQDTSPAQWAIIEALVDEFFAGEGARETPRTLFVVGDEKQSIYSFQGADLAGFRAVGERLFAKAGHRIGQVVIDTSFRTVPAILEVVDRVFALPAARQGVVDADQEVRHEAWRRNDAGLVELWPLAEPAPEAAAPEPWALPDEPRIVTEPEQRVADAIAGQVAGWLGRGELLESAGRPIRAGDVMVLLARRGRLQELLIRSLKRQGVPVAGADRLGLIEHIAVRDLMALGQAMLLPEDDLNLACLLKSPLVGLDEQALFDLAWDRGDASLMERLREAATREPGRFGGAHDRLVTWLRRADFMPPFEFYAFVLGEDRGRERMLARLGAEAAEPMELFLGEALAFERGNPASLQLFLHWLQRSSSVFKRDSEQAIDAVRVLTVHGAKGLEAPIVILADGGPSGGTPKGRLLWDSARELPFWRLSSTLADPLLKAASQDELRHQEQERCRLLYVALTRARDRLYVTGWKLKRAQGDDPCWHELVATALHALDGVERIEAALGPGFEGPILRYRTGVAAAPEATSPAVEAPAAALPDWMLRPAPEERERARATAVAHLDQEPVPASSRIVADPAEARRHGLLVHRLLELLPALPEAERALASRRWLEAMAKDIRPDARARIAADVLRVLAEPGLAPVFGPGSRAEQPIGGIVAGRHVSGQIDRLLVDEAQIIVVDYKTGSAVPDGPEAVPRPYLRQMACYRHLLQGIWPTRPIRCALVWTAAGAVTWLPAALLDAEIARLGTTS